MALTFFSHSLADTLSLGRAIGRLLRAGDFIGLDGPLGAGKTRLVRGIALGMGIDPKRVSSPTFVLVHEYVPSAPPNDAAQSGTGADPSPSARTVPLVHIDAYRLHSADELDTIGWDRIIDGSAAVVIEWAEKIERALPGPERTARIGMQHTGAQSRRVSVSAPSSWQGRPGWEELVRTESPPPPSQGRDWTTCPISGRKVAPDSPTYPFADEKCRMADLNRWMSGEYSISRALTEDDSGIPDDVSDPPDSNEQGQDR
ncbi:MAG: tRNA (adenosine(37)-N6)-threonylcarbamoyltransferase complex ATPase subunit type 1 TsaE [Phycisphaerae bacterium]|nr:tRNA (adenosine(37)-N6)-threonylcarbamoyltransferase complex ATPase subunit type 1 TsaE [Phycisphaerae bacterium]